MFINLRQLQGGKAKGADAFQGAQGHGKAPSPGPGRQEPRDSVLQPPQLQSLPPFRRGQGAAFPAVQQKSDAGPGDRDTEAADGGSRGAAGRKG